MGTPTKSGQFEFLGWTGEGITTPTKNVTIPANAVGDKSYKANWQEYYTITWMNNDPTNSSYIGNATTLKCYPIDVSSVNDASRDPSSHGLKRIKYISPDGNICFANPGVNSVISIKAGSALIFQMYSGFSTNDAVGYGLGDIWINNTRKCNVSQTARLMGVQHIPQGNIKLFSRSDATSNSNDFAYYTRFSWYIEQE